MFAFTDRRGDVEIAFTDGTLDLAVGNPDLSTNLAQALVPWPGARLVTVSQVHGATVHVAGPDAATTGASPPEADGVVTDLPGVALMIRAADCAPVLVADVERGIVGAAHAGRPGLVAGVVPATVEQLRRLGGRHLVAWVGPHVCGSCYEVPALMRADVASVVPEAFAQTSWGTASVDLGAGIRAQLVAAGVSDVYETNRCTREHDDLFSYRRQGPVAGRQAGLIWVRPG